MEPANISRLVAWIVSLVVIVLIVILYPLYVDGHLQKDNSVACSLESCRLINKTCTQVCPQHQPTCIPANFTCQFLIANYTFIWRNQLYSTSQELFVDQKCASQLNCLFLEPSKVHFSSNLSNYSAAAASILIFLIIVACSVCVVIPFYYLWQVRKQGSDLLIPKEQYQEV